MTKSYSARLGEISDAQFDAVLRKAGLGCFVAASTPSAGLFGQNVFLTSTQGDFVFRGAPHWFQGGPNDAWQFPKERLYADLLHGRTTAPVAWPQRLDDSCEHFPWPYLITPRLPGLCLQDREARAGLGDADWLGVARAAGKTLAQLHRLTWDFAGDFDPALQSITPYEGGYAGHLDREIARQGAQARANGRLTPADDAWLEGLAEADTGADGPATYVHNDYTLGNVLFVRDGEGWRVSGVVDLMTSCLGDPAADLVRLSCHWLDANPACAAAFLGAYARADGPGRPSAARLERLVAYERLLIWSYFTRPDVGSKMFDGMTFAGWARPYAARISARLDEAAR